MARATGIEAFTWFHQSGGRLISWRPRVAGDRVLVRVEMPDPESAAWARGVVAGAGLEVGGNDTPWETQVVFTVSAAALDARFPGWRTGIRPAVAAPPVEVVEVRELPRGPHPNM